MWIEPFTMMIRDLDEEEAGMLDREIRKLVDKGEISEDLRMAYDIWALECAFDDRQKLLVMTTVFPQYVLMSLVDFYRNKGEER
jgi:hypothetical protein